MVSPKRVSTRSTGETTGSTRDTSGSNRASSVAVATRSKSQLAYDFLKERIADGSFTPGYRLVLGQIAKELGVSVVPVREAIRLLEAEGLVQFERNVGAQVAMLDPTEYQVTMQTLSLVEGYATAVSAPFMTPDDVARARAINAELADCLQHFDPVNFTRLNLDFHAVLFEHCPNPHVLDLVDRGWARLRALRESTFSFVPGRAKDSVAEHEAILGLIERHAPSIDIELAARNHRLATLDAFLVHEASRSPLRGSQARTSGSGNTQTRTQGSGNTQTRTQGSGNTQAPTPGSGNTHTRTSGSGSTQTRTPGSGAVP